MKEERDRVGPAQGELLADRRLEPLAGSDRPVEDAGIADLDLELA